MIIGLGDLYELLKDQVASEKWWPAESDFEIFVGAILTQNTNWGNVEMSLARLKKAQAMTPQTLLDLKEEDLIDLIRSSGYYHAKAAYLKAMSQWVMDWHDQAPGIGTGDLRNNLLGVRGIGPETADDILLYVYHRPVFIYDLYARRLLKVAGYGELKSYEQAKKAMDPLVEREYFSVDDLANFHGLIVQAGKRARAYGGWEVAFERLIHRCF